jgi:tungstate transport system substrate-binding protein
MAARVRIAAETSSYTLADRATYMQMKPSLLAIVYEHDPTLLNTYAVVFDPGTPLALQAKSFADWLTTGRGRVLIETYTVGPGVRAFDVWPSGQPRDRPDTVPGVTTMRRP